MKPREGNNGKECRGSRVERGSWAKTAARHSDRVSQTRLRRCIRWAELGFRTISTYLLRFVPALSLELTTERVARSDVRRGGVITRLII